MGVTLKKDGVTVHDLLKKAQKVNGEELANFASSLHTQDIDRQKTGIFVLDKALGGGFPKGKVTTLYGKESSMKTAVALMTIGTAQLDDPDSMQIFIDVEDSFEPDWAQHFIPDLNRVVVLKPETAEEAVNQTESFMMAENVNVVVMDSLAALVTQNELDGDAAKMAVGGGSMVIGKLYKKVISRLKSLRSVGQYPSVIFINQLRFKIGQMFGNPETQPGGMAHKHGASLILKFYGKDVINQKESLVHWKQVNVTVEKKKMPTLNRKCEFEICVVPTEEGHHVGFIEQWKTVFAGLKDLHLMHKEGNDYILTFDPETQYPRQQDIRDRYMEDPEFQNVIHEKLIEGYKEITYGKGESVS